MTTTVIREIPASVRLAAALCLKIIHTDRPTFDKIDNYYFGRHAGPYIPDGATEEYKKLAAQSVTNWIPKLVHTPVQALFVDNYRSNTGLRGDGEILPQWEHWQRSGLDARQSAIYLGAVKYGHAFALTERDRQGAVRTRGLSARYTSAIFEDPANDLDPVYALHVRREPVERDGTVDAGRAHLWDSRYRYTVTFRSYTDPESVRILAAEPHGASVCPVTRFPAMVDLEGRTMGLVLPIIPVQDRINQTVFDLLLAQTYGSTKVRWVAGLAPPIKRQPAFLPNGEPNPDVGKPVLDEHGKPVYEPIKNWRSRFLWAEDPDTKFGTLDGTPLDGYVKGVDLAVRNFSALGAIPPHDILGEIANLSAEALMAAEKAQRRLVDGLKVNFGESWERVFRVAAELSGDWEQAGNFVGEVLWRDVELRSLSQAADALGKLAEQLGIPKRGLWPWVPGASGTQVQEWERLEEEQNLALQSSELSSRLVQFLQEYGQEPAGGLV